MRMREREAELLSRRLMEMTARDDLVATPRAAG
jgi:hypothetical protein